MERIDRILAYIHNSTVGQHWDLGWDNITNVFNKQLIYRQLIKIAVVMWYGQELKLAINVLPLFINAV